MTDQIAAPPPPPPATATAAQLRLDTLTADKAWGERLMAGDVTATAELRELTAKITEGGDDVVSAVIAGASSTVMTGEQHQMAETAQMFRELGIRDAVTAEFLSGKQVSKQEYDAVVAWKRVAMGSKEFTEKFLAGDIDARQKMTLANSVIVNGVKEEAA